MHVKLLSVALLLTYTNYHGPLRSCQVIREGAFATQIPANEVCPAAHGCHLCSPGNRVSASRPPGCTSSREHIHGFQEHHAAPVSQDPAVSTRSPEGNKTVSAARLGRERGFMERDGREHQNAPCALGACTTETNCHHHHHPPLTTAHLDSDGEQTGKEKTVDPHGESSDGMQARGLQEPEAPRLLQEEPGKPPQEGKCRQKLKRS